GDRAVERACLGCLADHDELLTVQLARDGLGILFQLEIARLKLGALTLEPGEVRLGRAQRLALRQKVIPRIAILHGDHFAHLAEFLDPLQQYDLHVTASLLDRIGKERQEPRALDGAGELTLLLGRDRGDAAGDDLSALRDEALEQLHVLVVDDRCVLARERAGLAAAEEGAAGHYALSSRAGRSSRSRRGPRSSRSRPRSPRGPRSSRSRLPRRS